MFGTREPVHFTFQISRNKIVQLTFYNDCKFQLRNFHGIGNKLNSLYILLLLLL